MSEVQEPHPQPPPRKQGGDYDVPHVISKRYSDRKVYFNIPKTIWLFLYHQTSE
ncbi:hypothetical protein [Nostoc sp.]|uniref:hypothetical protein n=1 Tax=Nostoc sp. TaxID=1180 RepID=UPI002FF47C0F